MLLIFIFILLCFSFSYTEGGIQSIQIAQVQSYLDTIFYVSIERGKGLENKYFLKVCYGVSHLIIFLLFFSLLYFSFLVLC